MNLWKHGIMGGMTLALALSTAIPTFAQERDQDQPRQSPEARARQRQRQSEAAPEANSGERSNTQSGDRQRPRRGQGDQQAARQSNVRMVPEGWVRVGTDYDGDGRFDAIETIYVFDLEQARQSSANRRQGGGPMTGRIGPGRPGYPPRISRVEGKIRNMKTVKLAGMDGEHVIARVETQEGRTARVHLGTKEALSILNLKEGSQVTVTGSRGLVNDQPMLMAQSVGSGDNTLEVKLPEDRRLKRVRGQLISTRTTKFNDRQGEQVIRGFACAAAGSRPRSLARSPALVTST